MLFFETAPVTSALALLNSPSEIRSPSRLKGKETSSGTLITNTPGNRRALCEAVDLVAGSVPTQSLVGKLLVAGVVDGRNVRQSTVGDT